MREAALVAEEVGQGLVSVAGALEYGVVIVEGRVDEVATVALREKIAKERPETGLFNRGGSIEELRERCVAETGLAAPRQPVWAAQG